MLVNMVLMAMLITPAATEKATADLVAKHGESQRTRAQRGVAQVAQFWRAEDGDDAAFQEFVQTTAGGVLGGCVLAPGRSAGRLTGNVGHLSFGSGA